MSIHANVPNYHPISTHHVKIQRWIDVAVALSVAVNWANGVITIVSCVIPRTDLGASLSRLLTYGEFVQVICKLQKKNFQNQFSGYGENVL